MRNWLIKLLGGWTNSEWLADSIRRQNIWESAREVYRQNETYYQDQLVLKDEEIQRLTNLMLREHGVIYEERDPELPKSQPTNESKEKVSLSGLSWQRRKVILEKQDLAKNAEVVKARFKEEKDARKAN